MKEKVLFGLAIAGFIVAVLALSQDFFANKGGDTSQATTIALLDQQLHVQETLVTVNDPALRASLEATKESLATERAQVGLPTTESNDVGVQTTPLVAPSATNLPPTATLAPTATPKPTATAIPEPTATSEPTATATPEPIFNFEDNFDSTLSDSWNFVGPSALGTDEGYLRGKGIIALENDTKDFTIEFKTSYTYYNVFFRAEFANDKVKSGYRFGCNGYYECSWETIKDGKSTAFRKFSRNDNYQLEKSYTLKIKVQGRNMALYIDDNPDPFSTFTDSTIERGGIGIELFSSAASGIDYFKVNTLQE